MNFKHAILLGIAIWIIGILFYSISYYVPILENADLQANIVLFILVIPIIWYATKLYYKVDNNIQGIKIGLFFLLIAIVLDSMITVPLFIIPNGGNHYSFFTSLGFWIIALEFLLVPFLYRYTQINHLKHK